MSELNTPQCCAACARLPELLAQLGTLQLHDAKLEGLLNEVEELVGLSGASIPAQRAGCTTHLPMLNELVPRLQKIYEALLIERHQLGKSISELDVLRSWSHQWTTGTVQSSHSITV
jgi:hypothetical protein